MVKASLRRRKSLFVFDTIIIHRHVKTSARQDRSLTRMNLPLGYLARLFSKGAVMFAFPCQCRLLGAALALLGIAALVLTTRAGAADLQTRLQAIADQAALVGATTLGTSEAPTEAERRAEAIRASKEVLSALPVSGEVAASIQDLTVTIRLSGNAPVISTARYLAPDEPANWAWAGRQHFALKRAPVVLGSTR